MRETYGAAEHKSLKRDCLARLKCASPPCARCYDFMWEKHTVFAVCTLMERNADIERVGHTALMSSSSVVGAINRFARGVEAPTGSESSFRSETQNSNENRQSKGSLSSKQYDQ